MGFQTKLKIGEQKRIFRMLPGLEHAEFVRYGMLHRNTYINGPAHLDRLFRWKKDPRVFFAGQLTGVQASDSNLECTQAGALPRRRAGRTFPA